MTKEDLVFALSGHGAGCDGCGYEHNCKHGTCRLMVEAAAFIQVMAGESAQLRKWANRFAAALGDKIIASSRMEKQLASLTAERDAAVTLIEKVNGLAVGAIEYGPYQDGEEAKLFFEIEMLTRTPAKQGEEENDHEH